MSFGNEIKDFVKAFTAAQNNQSKNRYYDYMEQQARLRTKLLEKKQQEADAPKNAYESGRKEYDSRGIGGFNEAVDRTIGFEGRSVGKDNNGAKVKFGINQGFNKDVDVANLTEDQARDIYKTRYWDPINGDELAKTNPALAHVAFDAAVNAGVPKAREFISGANGDPYKLLQLRQAHQDSLVANDNPDDPKYRPYANGWRNRNEALKADLDAYTGTGGGTTAAIPMPPRRPADLPSAPQAALPLPVSEQPAQYASLNDPNQEYLYEQPEYAASGGLIDRRALGIPRLPSLSANALNVGGGIGSNYSPNLPNLGRTMQAIPGVSSPAPLIPHYARGGFVDYGSDDSDSGGDDSVGDNEMQQASTALDTIGGGDSGDDENTPFSSVRPAVYDALHHIQNTFGLTPGAVQTNSQGFQAFASGAGRAHPELKQDVDKAVDPHDKMDDSLRNMAGLDALYKYYRDRGEIGKAQAAVSSLLLAAQDTASRYGAAALRAPNAKSAGKLVTEGINKTVPGVKAELDENGNYTFTDPVTGEVKETGQLSPQKLLAAAMGLKDGTMYWKTLSNFADPQRAQSAAQQKLRASAEADKTLQGGLQRALETEGTPGGAPATGGQGAPATGAPTIPGTPAAVGAPAAPALPIEQQPTALADPAAVMPKAPVLPGGKLTAANAAAIVGKPPNFVQTLTPDEQRALLGKSASVQKNFQATYEKHLIDRAQAKLSGTYQQPKEPTSAERNQIADHVDTAIDKFDEAIVKPMNEKEGKKDTGLTPSDRLQLKSVSQHLMHGNPDMYANEAVEFGAKMTVLPKNMPPIPVDENGRVDISKVPQGILPFRVIPATQEHGMLAQTKDGRTARITPKMREAILPVLQDSLQKRADEQREKAAASKASEQRARAIETMRKGAEGWITGLHPEGSMPMTTVPMD